MKAAVGSAFGKHLRNVAMFVKEPTAQFLIADEKRVGN